MRALSENLNNVLTDWLLELKGCWNNYIVTVINFFRYQKLRFESISYSKIISTFLGAIKLNKSWIENEPNCDKLNVSQNSGYGIW